MSRNYKELKVWELSHDLIIKMYKITKSFPKSEWHGLIPQMRRSAVSIAANIVEGAGRNGQKEYIHFLQIALSSAGELDYYIYLVKELEYIQINLYEDLKNNCQQIMKMLNGLIQRIKKDLNGS